MLEHNNSFVFQTYSDQISNLRAKSWSQCIKVYLHSIGLGYVWENQSSDLFHIIKQRVLDNYIQDWHASINSMSKLEYYCKYKKRI